jgi:hypothetical protein
MPVAWKPVSSWKRAIVLLSGDAGGVEAGQLLEARDRLAIG